MNAARFQELSARYAHLRMAVVGDFCLDRYLEIDPARKEVSIETGLPVRNVTNVRSQPGAAGTILNNLCALRVGVIYPVGFCGKDGEGYELNQVLRKKPGVRTACFLQSQLRRTFTYTKPLLMRTGEPPEELNRLDFKNWTPTPALLQGKIIDAVRTLSTRVDAVILMDQVDIPETGVVTARVLEAVAAVAREHPQLLILADSRRSLRGYPPVCFKMNAAELSALTGAAGILELDAIKEAAAGLAQMQGRSVFVTVAERGMIGASAQGEVEHVAALPLTGPIDVVGAGDAVSANLTCALAAGASLREALELANAAASVVIHQVGTTGTATLDDLEKRLVSS